MRDFSGKHLGFWGFGVEGIAAYRLAAPTAATVSIVAQNEFSLPRDPFAEIVYRGESETKLLDCDLVFVSPGVPRTHPFINELVRAGVETIAGTDLWLQDNYARTIGVTGTKGKSTTSSLIHAILRAVGAPTVLAGNIGTALLDIPPGQELVVAELSSYQCAWITSAPAISVVTNLYSEHLPWHGSQLNYWRDKARIIGPHTRVLVCDSVTLSRLREVADLPPELQVVVIASDDNEFVTPTGSIPLPLDELPAPLRAPHNAHNLSCALTAASFATVIDGSTAVSALLSEYTGLPHRLEVIAQTSGITWVSDTLSTAPESVIAAAESYSGAMPLVLIIGGQSRGVSYEVLNKYLMANAGRVQVVAIPGNGAEATADFARGYPERRHVVPDLDAAVRLSSQLAAPAGAVVLSPGAPSFDFYRNYADKTEKFRAAIELLARGQAPMLDG